MLNNSFANINILIFLFNKIVKIKKNSFSVYLNLILSISIPNLSGSGSKWFNYKIRVVTLVKNEENDVA